MCDGKCTDCWDEQECEGKTPQKTDHFAKIYESAMERANFEQVLKNELDHFWLQFGRRKKEKSWETLVGAHRMELEKMRQTLTKEYTEAMNKKIQELHKARMIATQKGRLAHHAGNTAKRLQVEKQALSNSLESITHGYDEEQEKIKKLENAWKRTTGEIPDQFLFNGIKQKQAVSDHPLLDGRKAFMEVPYDTLVTVAKQFRMYEKTHKDKGNFEKAEVNGTFAKEIETLIENGSILLKRVLSK